MLTHSCESSSSSSIIIIIIIIIIILVGFELHPQNQRPNGAVVIPAANFRPVTWTSL